MPHDFERGAKVAGSKFYFTTGKDAKQEWELINKAIGHYSRRGFEFVIPPFLINKKTAEQAGILPRFDGDFYETKDEGFILVPTAETPLVGMHSNEIIPEAELPLKYVAISPCFRREAGSAGKRDRGLRRVHQFWKVELFVICKPEDSAIWHREVVTMANIFLGRIGIHVRTRMLGDDEKPPVSVCTVDLETMIENEWVEVASISDTGQNQSKPALIRYRPVGGGKPVKCGLVNGTGLALPRVMLKLQESKDNHWTRYYQESL